MSQRVSLLTIEQALSCVLKEAHTHVVRGELEGGGAVDVAAPGNEWLRPRITTEQALDSPVSRRRQKLWFKARHCELCVNNALAGWLRLGLLEFCSLSVEHRWRLIKKLDEQQPALGGKLLKLIRAKHGEVAGELDKWLAALCVQQGELLDEAPVFNPATGVLVIGDQSLALEAVEADVLGALVEHRAIPLQQLRNESRCDEPHKVLKKLISKYPSLRRFISLPGAKGRGGYRTTIRRAPD